MDALTNNDWPETRRGIMDNYLLSPPVFSGESLTESVTLQEAKDQLIITNSDNDAYITALIKQCRQQFEQVTGIGLISRTVSISFNNGKGNFYFPYGPITAFTSLKDKGGATLAGGSYLIYGSPFSYMESPVGNYFSAVYIGGYTALTIPHGLKMDLLRYIVFCYENKGDLYADFSKALHAVANKHNPQPWLLG